MADGAQRAASKSKSIISLIYFTVGLYSRVINALFRTKANLLINIINYLQNGYSNVYFIIIRFEIFKILPRNLGYYYS